LDQFGRELEAPATARLDGGQRMQEVLKQAQDPPLSLTNQGLSLWAVNNGYLDDVPVPQVKNWEAGLHEFIETSHANIAAAIRDSQDLSDDTATALQTAVADYARTWTPPA